MKKALITFSLAAFFCSRAFSQTSERQNSRERFFEIGLMEMLQMGDIYTVNPRVKYYAALYPQSLREQAASPNHSGNHIGLSFLYGQHINKNLQLGLGINTEMYLNVGYESRFALPIYAHVKYGLPLGKNFLYSYGNIGYSPFTAEEIHAGAKIGAGIGYQIISRKSGHRYALSMGYNYQVLRAIEQNVFSTTVDGNTTTSIYIGSNLVKLGIHSLPISFTYTF